MTLRMSFDMQCENENVCPIINSGQGRIQGGNHPPKTYESKYIHHDFVQFAKQHSRLKAILPSTVLSQQCCKVCFISHAVVLTHNET